jgi:hypothetical protein
MGFQLRSLTAWALKKARYPFGVVSTPGYLPNVEAGSSDRSPRRRVQMMRIVRMGPAFLGTPRLTRRINARTGWRTSDRELVPGSNGNDRSIDTTAVRAGRNEPALGGHASHPTVDDRAHRDPSRLLR